MITELKNILNKYEICVNNNDLYKFELFYKYMIEYNKIHNLTSITEENEVILKHFLDSLFPYNVFEKNSNVIDIGCGAGFPSIPLSIIRTDIKITAIDSVNKKVEFVKNIKNTLELNNLSVIHARIEEIASNKSTRESFDYVVSRAVAPLNIILEYSAPLLKNNGYIISYKGSNYMEELNNAKNALKTLDCTLIDIKKFYIDELNTERYILIFKKNSNISNIYPRKQNKPRTNPL